MASQALLHGWLPALPFAEHRRFSAFLDTVVPLWVPLGSCSQLPLPFLPPSSRIGLFSKHTWKSMWMTPPAPPSPPVPPRACGPFPAPRFVQLRAHARTVALGRTWRPHRPEQLDRAKTPSAFGRRCHAPHEQRQSFFVSGAKDLADKMKRLR